MINVRLRTLPSLLAALIVLGFLCPDLSRGNDSFQLNTNTSIGFAGVAVGRDVLTRRDEFIAVLTPLDRRARMRSEEEISEPRLIEWLEQSVRPWTSEETNRITSVLQRIRNDLAPWALPFPREILLIKTSGREEFGMFYTRQNAIIFPASAAVQAFPEDYLRHVILHELFHVLSRHDPALRQSLYRILGFSPINEIVLPEELRRRKVSNPDGFHTGWKIELTVKGETLQVVPILLAPGATFDPANTRDPAELLRLLAVVREGDRWVAHVRDGNPLLVRPAETEGWTEQIGRNTGYIIHPDEILAENFVQLVTGDTNQPTPRIFREMEKVFGHRDPPDGQRSLRAQ